MDDDEPELKESYLQNQKPECATGRMSRGKMVLFFKYCFPNFLEIVLRVIQAQTLAFKNDSVFKISSKIPSIEQ